METRLKPFVHSDLYFTPVEKEGGAGVDAFMEKFYTTVLNEKYPNGGISLRDCILIYLAHFHYGTFDSFHVFNQIDGNGQYLRYRCLPWLLKQGYIRSAYFRNTFGKADKVFFLTEKGADRLREGGFLSSANAANDFLQGGGLKEGENIRSHEYALSLYLSSFIHADTFFLMEYEHSVRMSQKFKDYKNVLRPDAIITLFTPAKLRPTYLESNDLPRDTYRLNTEDTYSTLDDNKIDREYLARTYYVEQDMGTETFEILENKILSYYSHNLFKLDLFNPYSGIIFAFAKPYTPTSEHLSASSVKKLAEFIKEEDAKCVARGKEHYTLKSFLSMAPADFKKNKAALGDKTYEKIKRTAILLKNSKEVLARYNSTTNYDATVIYPAKPIPCSNSRLHYRANYIHLEGGRPIDTYETHLMELGVTDSINDMDLGTFGNRVFKSSNSVTKTLRIDPPASDYKFTHVNKEDSDTNNKGNLDFDMTYEDLINYASELSYFSCPEIIFDFNKAEYSFASTRTRNFCKYFTDRMEYFSTGVGSSNHLRTVRYMLDGLMVTAASSPLGYNSLYYVLPERSGYVDSIRSSLAAYMEINNSIFSYSYYLDVVPLKGFPDTHDIEADRRYICLEDINELVAVKPRFSFIFSFDEPDATRSLAQNTDTIASAAGMDNSMVTQDDDSKPLSASEMLAEFYKGNPQPEQEKKTAYSMLYGEFGNMSDDSDIDDDLDTDEDSLYLAERFIDNRNYLPPAINRSPLSKHLRGANTGLHGLYHVCAENISVDISGYVRMYYMCSFIRRDTNIMLLCMVDTYTDAAEFASQFPDLYVTENQDEFSFHGLQLVFMLNSDTGYRRNALFRVGYDGSIYRIKDNKMK